MRHAMTDAEKKEAKLRRLFAGYMKDRKVTILRLSDMTGIERTSLGKKLSGKNPMWLRDVLIISEALDIPHEDLAECI